MPDNVTSPADTRSVPRSQVIAAIHAFADFLAAHPELPAPGSVFSDAFVTDIRDGESVAEAMERWKDEHEAQRVFHGEAGSMATLVIASPDAHGVAIHYRAHGLNADRARPL